MTPFHLLPIASCSSKGSERTIVVPLLIACLLTVLVDAVHAQRRRDTQSVIEIDPQGRPERGKGEEVLIWREGDVWHIRSFGSGRRGDRLTVTGTIRIIGGKVRRLGGLQGLETPPATQKKKGAADSGILSPDNRMIEFRFQTNAPGEDGFEFAVTPKTTSIEFQILLSGENHPDKIRIGSRGHHPPNTSFTLPNKANE